MPPLASGQSKMNASVRKDGTGKVSVDYATRASMETDGGINFERTQAMIDAMVLAAKIQDAKHYAEDHEEASFVETPLYVPAKEVVVEKRLKLDEDEFLPLGIRKATDEDRASDMERWEFED